LTAFAQPRAGQPLRRSARSSKPAITIGDAALRGTGIDLGRVVHVLGAPLMQRSLLIEEPHREPGSGRDGKEECAGESHSRNEIPSCAHLAERRVAALDAIAPNVTCVVSRTAERHESAGGRGAAFAHHALASARSTLRARASLSAATLVVADAPSRAHEYAVPSTPRRPLL